MSDPDMDKSFTVFGEAREQSAMCLILTLIPLAGLVFAILHIYYILQALIPIKWINVKSKNFNLERFHVLLTWSLVLLFISFLIIFFAIFMLILFFLYLFWYGLFFLFNVILAAHFFVHLCQ